MGYLYVGGERVCVCVSVSMYQRAQDQGSIASLLNLAETTSN